MDDNKPVENVEKKFEDIMKEEAAIKLQSDAIAKLCKKKIEFDNSKNTKR